ncbi:MAG: NlpC/P60 family protein [Syntrophobacteraceae bacterium]|jgi:lysozyme|nr:NlpC/P60 family protein [Syntrophobacteraceae bacterium]
MTRVDFIEYCKEHLGKPYIWGSNGPDSFDCSGFAQVVLARLGLDPPGDQTANDIFRHFSRPDVGEPVSTPECACLVFYGKPARVGHVAICLNDSEMIEAGGGGPETTTVEKARKEGAEVRIRPIRRRSDIVAVIRPRNLPWSRSPQPVACHALSPSRESKQLLYNTIDISHWQTVQDFQKVKDNGIDLVFHKATQGFKYIDPVYSSNRDGFMAVGMAWGSYHFGTGGDGSDQADHFLSVADRNGLLVLDLEGNPQGKSIKLEEAEEFVQYLRDVTGRYPGLYSGHTVREMLGKHTDTPLARCWLWTARYSSNAPVIPEAWEKWTFWQYTDGKHGGGPHSVDGIGICDRNIFNGDKQEFEEFLKLNTTAS